ncbi:restriction endonuclease subunit S [Candidatus Thiosymbion oneisti]|uniref:restriction endonuclease subunit S n=1 Tax=Candidatus Thiosymbion oneisti TaxID=589554 RepID=UPI000A75BC9C|nr:restriction endonuclease subunit S [Candidatus Thiosymbion oneisti]
MSEGVPSEWSRTLLGEVFNIAIGGTPSRNVNEYWDKTKTSGNAWVSIKDLNQKYVMDTEEYITDVGVKNSNAKLIPKGTVMMSFKLTIGRTALAGRDLYTNEAIASFIPKDSSAVDTRYFYQGLQHWNLLENVDQAVKGATLNKEKLSLIEGIFPEYPEQQKIASILTSVDDVIEKTEAQISKLQDLKQGMMQELLTKGIGHTEFKPAPKWRVGEFPEQKVIPATWELVDILSVAKLESGHTPSRNNPDYWNGNVQWLSLHDTKQLSERVIRKTAYTITEDGLANSSARLLQEGTVAFSRTASVGHCVILGCEMATSQDFANYVCGNRLHNGFLMQMFRWMQHVWQGLAGGSTHQTIYMPDFKQLQILLPPLEEQRKITAIANGIDDAVEATVKRLQPVKSLKRALMQDLLTGRVRVKTDG